VFISVVLCASTLDRAVASAEALERPDPLIDSIVGDDYEDVSDDDAKQFAAYALAGSESGQHRGCGKFRP
jgi:hypothetical protein